MENYSYATSYPDSGNSSPRSREIDFENPPPWEDLSQAPSNYKVKFMCSYGGKIHPRPNDNQLSYIGGETKILAVDRHIKFSGIISKLCALCDTDVSFKYQLPGEDLDALISVTDNDDLEHMMQEYDRLYRASAKPARLRLFLFPVIRSDQPGVFETKSEREQFVEALNSSPVQVVDGSSPPARSAPDNVDFLFGLDKATPVAVSPSPPVPKRQDPVSEPNMQAGSDLDLDIQRRILELQRLRIGGHGHGQAMYGQKSDDNSLGAHSGDFNAPKLPEQIPTTSVLPVAGQSSAPVSTGYWATENQVAAGGYPAIMSTTPRTEQQPMYMMSTPPGMYHAPMRPLTNQVGQGYYAVQRMASDGYREQPVYNAAPPSAAVPQSFQQIVRPSGGGGGGGGMAEMGYAQVAYDSAGRQVYYTAPGGRVPQYQGMTAVSADMRPAAALSPGGPIVTKVSQASV